MILEQYSDILTVEELCEVLGIGANAAYQLLNDGPILLFALAAGGRYPKTQ